MADQPTRGRPRDEQAQQSILQTTRDLLLDGGYTALSIEGVARSAGVAKTTIYRWWSSKARLVIEASADNIDIGIVPNTGESRQDLLIAAQQLIATFSDPITRVVMTSVIAELGEDPWLAMTFRDRYVYPWRESAAQAFARAQERGDLPSDADLSLLLDILVGTVFQRTVTSGALNVTGLDESLIDLILAA